MNIIDQHSKAFAGIAAYVVTDKSGTAVARVAFKFGARTTCYFHVYGAPMTRGSAGGGGYDKSSTAAYAAVRNLDKVFGAGNVPDPAPEQAKALTEIYMAIRDTGRAWDDDLRANGFNVIQAV